jgi:hypothetical protein
MSRTIGEELRHVLSRASLLDAVVGPLAFAIANAVAGTGPAVAVGLGSALAVVLWRLVRGGSLTYAAGGVGGTVIASLLVGVTGRAEDYFLPGILSGAAMSAALLVSLMVRYPLVAVVSSVTRQWPLGWYRHPRVRPAYMIATWIWAGFFGARALVQYLLYREGSVEVLATVRVATGWPALLGLLVITYLVGRWRLESLAGPSVEEWESDQPPPWRGQEHGF